MPRTRTILLIGAAAWCGAILAAPVFHASFIYEFFSRICHQDPERSWRVFGEPLAVCIRCSSIYVGFLIALVAGLPPSGRALRIAIAANVAEFVLALILVDSAALRSLCGLALGAAAAPIVLMGVEQATNRVFTFGRERDAV